MRTPKLNAAALIAITAVATLLTVTTAGLLSVNQAVPSSGTITALNVGVYSDSACTQELTSVDWGTVSPGETVTRTIYIKNTGNSPVTLTMTKTNWNPSTADGPIAIAWDIENWWLNPDEIFTATLTLSVSSSISGITDFSVEIVITGTEYVA